MDIVNIFAISCIHLVAVMSPCPDFAMVTRNSLVYSRRVGIFTSIGISLGILVHIAYSLIGIGFVISKSIVLFSMVKYLGAGYLIYLGFKSFKSTPNQENFQHAKESKNITDQKALRIGFITNVLNPKATLYFLGLFTQVIDSSTTLPVHIFYAFLMLVITFLWFGFVSIVLSHKSIKSRFMSISHYVDKAFGAMLVALGLKVALSNSK